MSKLTALQATTLKRFAAGEIAHRCLSMQGYSCFLCEYGHVTIRRNTLRQFMANGWIEERSSYCHITAAGKALAATL